MTRFTRATKDTVNLRGAFFGPAGAGKTLTTLRVMRGLVGPTGRIAVIDTEANSSRRYADRYDFDQLDLTDPTIDDYVQAIDEARAAGYHGLIIDSLSHGWKWLTQEVELIAKAKYRGNTWSAWSEGTPLWESLTRAILRFNQHGHVLATMQSKTEWITADTGGGKKTPQQVGLSPNAGKGIEYEFDFLVQMTADHHANVIKDRTGRFQDRALHKPGEDFGAELAAWLTASPTASPTADDTLAKISTASAAALEKLEGKIHDREAAGSITGADANRLRAAIAARRECLTNEVAT